MARASCRSPSTGKAPPSLPAVRAARPDAVINCAAWTDVDGAEAQEAAATLANGDAAGALAEACGRRGAFLVHYSTDYVFNGAAEQMFRCTAAEAVGRPLDTFIPMRSRGAHREHVRLFGAGGVTSRRMGALGAVSGLRADGEEFPIEASISRTVAGGQAGNYPVLLVDGDCTKIAQENPSEQRSVLSFAAVTMTAVPDPQIYDPASDPDPGAGLYPAGA